MKQRSVLMKPLFRNAQLTLVVRVLSDSIKPILQKLPLNATRLNVCEMFMRSQDLCFKVIGVVPGKILRRLDLFSE